MLDGFVQRDSSLLNNGSLENISRYRNTFSPYSEIDKITKITPKKHVHIDKYYGLAYDHWIEEGGAFYGKTDKMEFYGIDHKADMGFLRIPFRRIPRISIKKHDDINSILHDLKKHYKDHDILYRGQTKEYFLSRGKESLKKIYGCENTLEPSLLNTSSRTNTNIDSIIPEWSGLLRVSFGMYAQLLDNKVLSDKINDEFNYYPFMHYALSIAQHYGLPTNGLDVTSDIETALFFALNTYHKTGAYKANYLHKRDWKSKSVIYIFALPHKYYSINHEEILSGIIPKSRPSFQNAFFLHNSRGLNINNATEHLVAALYLDNSDAFKQKTSELLFPNRQKDLIGNIIFENLFKAKSIIPNLDSYLKYFYWIN
ncbi:FRG domain-containing protein [uncultured Dokdonia sp.]|uniref:FRG domain-containing protein n=1 Tax=uncultured Dokdonia sp. TaxID=575653 RepID=UPI002614B7E2|nr:FRG domain-containing protein [uncultured Dokdonia sp.]